jgi:hypothetical protein
MVILVVGLEVFGQVDDALVRMATCTSGEPVARGAGVVR